MDKKIEGSFSLGLCSLQFQLQHLLEGSGGELACSLLDVLAELNEEERKGLLEHFIEVARGLGNSDKEAALDEERFESDLYRDILGVIEQKKAGGSRQQSKGEILNAESGPKLELLEGKNRFARQSRSGRTGALQSGALRAISGGQTLNSRLIDFQDAKNRRSRA